MSKNNLSVRINNLWRKIAQNIERGTYYTSDYDTIGDTERYPIGGDIGGSPVNSAKPDNNIPDQRNDRTMYPRYDLSLSVVSKDYPIYGTDSVHFVSGETAVADGGSGVVTLL